MANINLSIGSVNITANYLIVRARKVSTPLVEETREEYPTPLAPSFNVVLPPTGSIDPVNYYVDFYESADGVALDFLLTQFVVNARDNIIISERRFYRVGGGGANDPAAGQAILSDPYLDGKTISGVFREAFRYLLPPTDVTPEYDLHTGGGIELLNDSVFSEQEVISIELNYLVPQPGVSATGFYNGVITLVANTTLNSTHRNKRLRCESNASSRLVVTLEDVTAVPDGTFYYFTSNGGNQYQTKIVPASGQSITYFDSTYDEMTLAYGEYIRVVKYGSIWEAELVHHGVLQVGERISGQWKDHPNTKPEDGTLYDGDDYPRIWWFITTKLPSTHVITDDLVTGGGYVHPVGKEGLFVRHSTLKQFRMPNTQGWSERGLASFSAYNTDATRTYDYPGGSQPGQVGEITVPLNKGDGYTGHVTTPNRFAPGQNGNPQGTDNIVVNSGKVNTVKNIGVIYLRRI